MDSGRVEDSSVGHPESHPSHPEDETSLLELLNVLLRHWRIVVGLPLAAGLLTAMVSLAIRPTYTATTGFVSEAPAATGLPSGLSGLAGQFGISVGGDATQSPDFYAQLLTSRAILDRALLDRFPSPQPVDDRADSVTLLRLLGVGGEDLPDSLERARKVLAARMVVRVERLTGIVRLSVDERSPWLAAAVANAIVRYVDQFNAENRQSHARERRRFVETRLAEAERALRQSEEDLRRFYERNRSWQQSPQLAVEEDRLGRQVQIRQEVYLTLNREYETARIQEVNDTPVITVIDAAVPSRKPSKPKRNVPVALAIVLGGLLGVAGAFVVEYAERIRLSNQVEYMEFRSLVKRLRGDLGTLLKRRRGQGAPPGSPGARA